MARKNYRQAEEAFRSALEHNPEDFGATLGLVESLLRLERTGEAIAVLQDEVERHPGRIDLQTALGNTAVRAKKYDLAIDTFQTILASIDADSQGAGDIFLRLGEAYRRRGDLPSAAAALQKAKRLLPTNPVVLSTLALVLDGTGQKTEAIATYRETLALSPDNAVAMNNLAFLISESGGDINEALALAKRASELLPGLAEISDTLGWIYLKLGESAKAVEVFKALVERDARNATFHYHFGMALAQKGDRGLAREQLQIALTLDPTAEERSKVQNLLDLVK